MKTELIFIPKLNLTINFSIGENDLDNFFIIKNSSQDDIWFHLHHVPSCHIIAHTNDLKLTKKQKQCVIKQGVHLCHVMDKKSIDCSVVYTQIKHVVMTEIAGRVSITNEKIS